MPSNIFSNVDFSFRYGPRAVVNNTEVENGAINIATDFGEVYIDIMDIRVPINDVYVYEYEADIRALESPINNKIYYAKDSKKLMMFNSYDYIWEDITLDVSGLNERFNYIEELISSINSFEIKILNTVDDIPEIGQPHIIYFVPENSGDEDTLYDEFVWIITDEFTGDGYYEKIGISRADLTNYYSKEEADETFASKSEMVTNVKFDDVLNAFTQEKDGAYESIISANNLVNIGLTKEMIMNKIGFTPAKLYDEVGTNEDGAINQAVMTDILNQLPYISDVQGSGTSIFVTKNGEEPEEFNLQDTTYEPMSEEDYIAGTSSEGKLITPYLLSKIITEATSDAASIDNIRDIQNRLKNIEDLLKNINCGEEFNNSEEP